MLNLIKKQSPGRIIALGFALVIFMLPSAGDKPYLTAIRRM